MARVLEEEVFNIAAVDTHLGTQVKTFSKVSRSVRVAEQTPAIRTALVVIEYKTLVRNAVSNLDRVGTTPQCTRVSIIDVIARRIIWIKHINVREHTHHREGITRQVIGTRQRTEVLLARHTT